MTYHKLMIVSLALVALVVLGCQMPAPDSSVADSNCRFDSTASGSDFDVVVLGDRGKVIVRVPKAIFGEGDPAEWGYALVVMSQEGFPAPGVRRVRDVSPTAEQWRVGGGGSVKSVGVGGPLTGRGAHVLVIDDPVKDDQKALSEIERNRTWSWYTQTAYTRLAPGGGVLFMMTRWHEDDLAGRLLEKAKAGGDQWRVVSFPAIAEEDEEHLLTGPVGNESADNEADDRADDEAGDDPG